MVITSTQYQQNVGYYFDLAKKGEEIIVEKQRPKGERFRISYMENKKLSEKEIKFKELVDRLQDGSTRLLTDETPLEFQHRVRS